MQRLVLLLLFSLYFLVVSTKPVTIHAVGATVFDVVMKQWGSNYELATGYHVDYLTGAGFDGKALIKTTDDFDFATSIDPYTPEELATNPEMGLMNFPFISGPIAFMYNLPGSPTGNVTPALILTRETVVGIYNGSITHWNDPRLIESQDSQIWRDFLAATDKPIRVMFRSDTTNVSGLMTTAFNAFSEAWSATYGVFNQWPEEFYNGTKANFTGVNGPNSMFATVAVTPYSIGYLGWSVVIGNSWTSVARMRNKAGRVIDTLHDDLSLGLKDVVMDGRSVVLQANDLDHPDAYPVMYFGYLIVKQTPYQYDCAQRREVWKFLNFIYTQQNSTVQTPLGFLPVSPQMSEDVMKVIRQFRCEGTNLLKDTLTYDEGFILPVALVAGFLGLFSLFVVLLLLFLFLNPKDKRLPVPMILFGINMFLAAILGYIEIGLWLLIPSNDHICMARVWLGTLAVAMMLGGSISRASQIKRLNAALHSISKMEDMIHQKLWRTFRDLFMIVAVQLMILVIWQCVDPYRSIIVITDPIQMTGEYQCASDSLGMWGAEAGFLSLIILYGLVEIYIAWNLPSQTNQSKWILFSLYNCILTGAVCLPIFSLVKTEKEYAIIAIVGQTFLFFQMQVSYMIPSFYSGIYRSSQSSGESVTSTTANRSVSKTPSRSSKHTTGQQ